jgi:CBS domain containing-hemolysin-like protein
MVRPNTTPSSVAPDASAAAIRAVADRSGHLRLLVRDEDGIKGVVHVRDSLRAGPVVTAADLMRPVLTLDADAAVYDALRTMRETSSHLAIVTDNGELIGVVTLTDVLARLRPAAGAGIGSGTLAG